ncbi:DUF1129 family protein [Tuanshanicoccus lijuaniae]|uniref:DUF1129 domain-containing protein n=1 Tax=Aerococcaceae bacterium zg-1292 TaxID=2774330 RepID=UPI0019381426|nr:DUF1129 family protein [Aerococcaceae bacterium zg-1292]MBF6626452.1 DUF1129 family protein [Aerococcaceae bacterium zg-BR9]MBS4455671.1 DUF1129 family protein [Aerococcaceae bacterium zg-A91]MBS4457422.1 DUF1129 family protein [Aerococcaceae bacterium zg-BR33]QQA37127.1 DUF1129 family protein [Aerococcaceae bacterium zg-1292]
MTDKTKETVEAVEVDVDVLEDIATSDEVDAVETTPEAEANVETTEVKSDDAADVYVVPNQTSSVLTAVTNDVFNRLTKKNQQYLMAVDKHLESEQIEQSAYQAVFTEIAETLIQGQKTGQTAKQLYGTPTECAAIIKEQHFPTEAKENLEPSEPWKIALDGSLLLGSIYAMMTGISLLNARNIQNTVGLLTLIVNYIVAGFAMLLIARNLPKPDAPKGERGYLRYFGMSSLAMISWVAAVSLVTAFVPPVINPVLPPMALVVIGLVTIAARFYLKRRLNIRGGVF